MRILQVDSGREWRGGQNQVRLLCHQLIGRPELENRLFTKKDGELARRARGDLVPTIQSPWTVGVSPTAFLCLGTAIRRYMPAIVHVHDSHSLTLALAVRRTLHWPFLGGRGISGKLVLDEEPTDFAIIAHRRVDFHVKPKSNWTRADRVIAVSDGVKQVLVSDGVNPRDVAVIPDGIDPEEVRANANRDPAIRKRLGLPLDVPLAVNAAALVDHKDHETLIRAAARARARVPQLHWVIAGEGPLRGALQREIANLGVGDIVHLVGYVEPVDALIREASVFVMSSKEEGMGSVVLQALALSKPVVATAAGGLPEIVPPEWLVPVGDAETLAAKTLQALEHPTPIPLAARFTAKAMAEATLAQYRTLA
ncbi:MAG TPA: glycosyltransferase [Gemmatimonadales bacterium]|nr:glycosyltransferase [Gemmatimonadales bacterium]